MLSRCGDGIAGGGVVLKGIVHNFFIFGHISYFE